MDFLTVAVSALWLGILTSLSPCPLAGNIAAISYIGKKVDNIGSVFLAGLLYTLGRVLTYLVVGVIVVAGALSIPQVSNFLQMYMNKILGPILIIAGMFLLELISVPMPDTGLSGVAQKFADKSGAWGAFLMGVLFALSFCPVSAAFFFGSLIPLSISSGSRFVLPSLYGLGTGLPVIVFAFVIAFSAHAVGTVFNKLRAFELWARRVTGIVFIIVGIYFSLRFIFKIM